MSTSGDYPDEDVMSILFATDNHLGYNEDDNIRGNDSFIAFEEILQIAKKRNVDFILLGGDLFHDSQPSANSIFRCVTLLRKYCLGDRPISIECMSDQSEIFNSNLNSTINYEDPNQNIAIPVFSIHGNHDDPVGINQLSSLDLLSNIGLINYFGKTFDLTNISIKPILLKKGKTKLQLFGLSHIKDDRLSRLFRDNKVTMFRPEGSDDDWFSLLVLHQNRADRGPSKFIPESVIPFFIDFVFWGHEHDCKILPGQCAKSNAIISQPGSSVATSLAEGESGEKKIAILKIYKKEYSLEPIRLKTVRPFVFDNLILSDSGIDIQKFKSVSQQVEVIVKTKIKDMLESAKELLTDHPLQPKLPLIRLRVIYNSTEQLFNVIRLTQSFGDQVANLDDMILLVKDMKNRVNIKSDLIDKEVLDNIPVSINDQVEDIVEKYFASLPDDKQLQVLSVTALIQGVLAYVGKNEVNAIELIYDSQIKGAIEAVINADVEIDEINSEIENFKKHQLARKAEIKIESNDVLSAKSTSNKSTVGTSFSENMSDPEESVLLSKNQAEQWMPPACGRGSRRGRGSRARGARAASTASSSRTTRSSPRKGRTQTSLVDIAAKMNSSDISTFDLLSDSE